MKIVILCKAFIGETFIYQGKNILQIINIYVIMDYRFLGIAWPSPVTVDLLLCNMKLLYEDMSMKPHIF